MAKRTKSKGPKTIAGVRIPKSARPALRPLAWAVDTRRGRTFVAGAVVAAAAVAWRNDRVRAAVNRIRVDATDWMRKTAIQALGPVAPDRAPTTANAAATAAAERAGAESVYGLEPDIAAAERRTH